MNKQTLLKATVTVALIGGITYAYAAGGSAGGTEFNDVWTLLKGWSQGVLGKIIALGALIVGIAFGLVRQSVVAAVVGIAMALVLQYGPDVIDGIVGATAMDTTTAQVMVIDNGMSDMSGMSEINASTASEVKGL